MPEEKTPTTGVSTGLMGSSNKKLRRTVVRIIAERASPELPDVVLLSCGHGAVSYSHSTGRTAYCLQCTLLRDLQRVEKRARAARSAAHLGYSTT